MPSLEWLNIEAGEGEREREREREIIRVDNQKGGRLSMRKELHAAREVGYHRVAPGYEGNNAQSTMSITAAGKSCCGQRALVCLRLTFTFTKTEYDSSDFGKFSQVNKFPKTSSDF